MEQIKRDLKTHPIDPSNEEDLLLMIRLVLRNACRRGYFKRWDYGLLLSEGWIQILKLKKSYDPEKNSSFSSHCFAYLPSRISDGMSLFEEGMKAPLRRRTIKSEHRWVHRTSQLDHEGNTRGELNESPTPASSEDGTKFDVGDYPGLVWLLDRSNSNLLTKEEFCILRKLYHGETKANAAQSLGHSSAWTHQIIKKLIKKGVL